MSIGPITASSGQFASGSITIGRASGANGVYNTSFPTHPNSTSYIVIATAITGATSNTARVATVHVVSSTQCNVWIRQYDNPVFDGDFSVITVP